MSGAGSGVAVGAMLSSDTDLPQRDRWARLRFAIIGPLLAAPPAAAGIAPLLKQMIADYAATGLPPAYLPTPDKDDPV
jgi:hypothetical protein